MSFGEGNLRTAVRDLQDEIERLENRNAALRMAVDYRDERISALESLVRDILPCYRWSDCYTKVCENEGGRFTDCPTIRNRESIEERVKALGIEVDR